MNRIGLLTFHASHNCGSMLQTYALQHTVKEMGNEIEIIDFSNKGQKELYNIFYKNNNIKNLIKNMIILPKIKRIKKISNSYNKFMEKNFILSKKKYENVMELDESKLLYNTYICGSDQIWNITLVDGDDAYFLPFVKNMRKIAYAPSFGAKNPCVYAKDINKYIEYLNDFDYLSVREINGQKWIKEMINKEVQVVLDPTLLLKVKDYEKIEQEVSVPEKFIFYYAPGYYNEINKFVDKVSKKYNLPVIVFNSKQYFVKGLKKFNFILPDDENPGVYLYLMKKAELVFTTSFHGTIFSTIYNKKFWTLKNGGMYGDDDRVRTLITQLSMEERLIVPQFDDNFEYLQEVDYNKYYEKLDELQSESIKYLKEALDINGGNNE